MGLPVGDFLLPNKLDDAALLQKLIDKAAAASLPFFRSPVLRSDNKASGRDFDPVTQADRAAEAAMREVLESERPDDGILGEEFGPKLSKNGRTWVLDPIDGTRAFLAGAPSWGTLIALNDGTRVVLSAVSQPFIGEVFLGEPKGAFWLHNDRRQVMTTRACPQLGKAILMTTFPEVGTPDERMAFERVSARALLTRYGFDCYAYCLLALGQIDLVIEAGLEPYDVQGPIGVIEAAGGIVTNWQGESAMNGGQILAAGDARLHERVLELLNP